MLASGMKVAPRRIGDFQAPLTHSDTRLPQKALTGIYIRLMIPHEYRRPDSQLLIRIFNLKPHPTGSPHSPLEAPRSRPLTQPCLSYTS